MSNKKDIKQQVRSDVTMLEELTKLKKDIEAYKKSGEQMGEEILYLKRQNAGLKGHNKKLQERVEHYKQLDLEGDELNEEKISKIESLTKELEKVNKELQQSEYNYCQLSAKAAARKDIIQQMKTDIGDLKKENKDLRTTIESYKKAPWYKKVFRHK